jgi:hypothetical protein
VLHAAKLPARMGTTVVATLERLGLQPVRAVEHVEDHALGEGCFLVARLSEQIRRVERDNAAASRLYTIVAGA